MMKYRAWLARPMDRDELSLTVVKSDDEGNQWYYADEKWWPYEAYDLIRPAYTFSGGGAEQAVLEAFSHYLKVAELQKERDAAVNENENLKAGLSRPLERAESRVDQLIAILDKQASRERSSW